ncbi:MAG TPA: dehydratase, partial [Mycobacterium sp.]|nr:dehydratase [Mycobacterium sp.]
MTQPSGMRNMLRAVAGALPFVSRTGTLPNRTLRVAELIAYFASPASNAVTGNT